MKKKIFFLGFIVFVFVTLFMLPTSAAVTLPDMSEGCDACIPTWFQIDRANHCDSQCVCSWGECPQCGKNTVLIYCNRTHMMSHYNWNTDQIVGHAYDQTSKCSRCGVTKTVVAVYRAVNCDTQFSETDIVAPTCTSYGYTVVSCKKGHTDCRAALGMLCASHWNFTDPISEHDIYFSRTVAPTCSSAGYDEYKCSNCSMIGKQNVVEPSGHISAGDDITVDATCTERAYHQYTCSHCGNAIKEYFGELAPHNHALVEYEAASCGKSGYSKYQCTVCEDSYTETVPALTHVTSTRAKFDDSGFVVYQVCMFCFVEIPVEDPCTDCAPFKYSCECGYGWKGEGGWSGLQFSASTFGRLDYFDTCTDCGATFNFSLWTVHDYVRSIEDNTVYDICQNCGDVVFIKELDPDEGIDPGDCSHDYARATVPPTCLEHGYYIFVCTLCNDSYIDGHIDPLGHDAKTEVLSPTCIDDGHTKYTCSRCDQSWISDLVPALGHNFVNGFCTRCGRTEVCIHTFVERVVPPTCHGLGYTIYTCSLCGDIYRDNFVNQLEHVWANAGSRDPSCDTAGYKQLKCILCGDSKIENIIPYGHKWIAKGSVIQEDKQALVTFRCSTCGTVKTDLLPTASAQAQNWLLTVIGGLSSGIIDMYNTVANGVEIGGVTAGQVIAGCFVLVVVVGFVGFAWGWMIKK